MKIHNKLLTCGLNSDTSLNLLFMNRKTISYHQAKSIIAVIILILILGLNSYGIERLWNHGDKFDVKESKSSSAVNIITGEGEKKITSVEILPSFFSDSGARAYLYGEMDTLRYTANGISEIYTISGDTLQWLGNESRSKSIGLDDAVPVCRLPIVSDCGIRSHYSGILSYWGDLPVKRIFGTSESSVTNGITLTADGDTVHGVTMLGCNTAMNMEPDTAQLHRGSLIFEDDIIDRTTFLTCRKVFFATDCENKTAGYPMLTITDTYMLTGNNESSMDTVALGSVTRWMPELTALASERKMENMKPRHTDDGADEEYFPINIDTRQETENELTVTLSSQNGQETLTATLCTTDGIIIGSSQTLTITTVPSEYRFQLPSDIRGVILLRLETSDASRTIKIIR